MFLTKEDMVNIEVALFDKIEFCKRVKNDISIDDELEKEGLQTYWDNAIKEYSDTLEKVEKIRKTIYEVIRENIK